MPIRDEAINVFMGLPGDGPRLELTYNFGVDSYELGTGYNHIAISAGRPRRDARAPARAGDRGGEAAVHGQRERPAAVLRARPGRLPDRAHRTCRLTRAGGRRPRLELLPPRRLRDPLSERAGRARRLVEADRRDLRAGADRRRRRRDRRARRGRHGARERRDRGVRPLLRRGRPRRRRGRRRRDERDPRGERTRRTSSTRAREASGLRDPRALARGGGPLRLPRRGQLDRPARRRGARHRRRLAAARRASRDRLASDLDSWRLGAVRMTERFLPDDGPASAQAARRALREHVARKLERAEWLAGAERHRRPRRHDPQPRGGAAARARRAGVRRPGLPRSSAPRSTTSSTGSRGLTVAERRRVPGHQAGARRHRARRRASSCSRCSTPAASTRIEATEAGLREGIFFAQRARRPPRAAVRRRAPRERAATSPRSSTRTPRTRGTSRELALEPVRRARRRRPARRRPGRARAAVGGRAAARRRRRRRLRRPPQALALPDPQRRPAGLQPARGRADRAGRALPPQGHARPGPVRRADARRRRGAAATAARCCCGSPRTSSAAATRPCARRTSTHERRGRRAARPRRRRRGARRRAGPPRARRSCSRAPSGASFRCV